MRSIFTTILLLSSLSLLGQTARSARDFDGAVDGKHYVAFMPFGGMVAYNAANPTIGFEYEYIFNREAGIGLRLPVALGYVGPEQGGNYYSGNSYKHTAFYAAPGIRFHAPFGGSKNAEFCTGPALLLGNIHFRPYNDYYTGSGSLSSPFDYGLTGIIADNSLNFYRRHFIFGFDVRVGTLVETHESSRFFMHIGMHFGGKF